MGLGGFGPWFTIALELVWDLIVSSNPPARSTGLVFVAIAIALLLPLLLLIRRRWRDSSPDRALAAALDLGRKMLAFCNMRAWEAPEQISPWRRILNLRRHEVRPAGDRGIHDAETMAIWSRLFARDLGIVLARLHKHDLIDGVELTKLCAPRTPAEVQIVARRLMELGCWPGIPPDGWAVRYGV
jgi:hypothetical protein